VAKVTTARAAHRNGIDEQRFAGRSQTRRFGGARMVRAPDSDEEEGFFFFVFS
jgi:hypothetical protein